MIGGGTNGADLLLQRPLPELESQQLRLACRVALVGQEDADEIDFAIGDPGHSRYSMRP
jgi:hypothetical protein